MRTSRLMREDDECLCDMAQCFVDENLALNALPADKLRQLPKAVLNRVLRIMCGRGLTAVQADSVCSLLEGEGLAYADIAGMRVSRDNGYLIFGVTDEKLPDLEIKAGESIKLPNGMTVTSFFAESQPKVFNSLNTLCFKYDTLCGKMFLTSRKDGDRIKLSHRNCTKSLKDLFSEKKMTQAERNMTPVIRDEKGVVAVYGFGICERCKAEPGDKVLCITINNNDNISGVKNHNG